MTRAAGASPQTNASVRSRLAVRSKQGTAVSDRTLDEQPLPHARGSDRGSGPAAGFRAMARQSLVKEFFLFIKQEKKWWLAPLIAVLLLVGAIIVLAVSSPWAPFAYPLF